MQSEGLGLKRLIFSEVTLIVRSPFALPSVWLRSAFVTAIRCLEQRWQRNRLVVNGLWFLDTMRSLGGDFCIIRNKN